MGVPLARIDRALEVLHPTGNPYLDLCMWKGRFPSRKAQFCTEFLKFHPLAQFMIDVRGTESWQGIRRDESANRKDALAYEPAVLDRPWAIVRPIVEWTAQQTVDFIISRGQRLNPLYSQGMGRVGCMPCINCAKAELREIGARWSCEVDRVREWEIIVAECSKRGTATFFADPDGQRKGQTRRFRVNEGYANIDEVMRWASTVRGGRQFTFAREMTDQACSSLYGLCE